MQLLQSGVAECLDAQGYVLQVFRSLLRGNGNLFQYDRLTRLGSMSRMHARQQRRRKGHCPPRHLAARFSRYALEFPLATPRHIIPLFISIGLG
jgi:hypothetical protein